MKIKPWIITLFASSFFLTIIHSIWKIMATLQGHQFLSLNFSYNFLIGLSLILIFILIGNKTRHIYKIIALSSIATILVTPL